MQPILPETNAIFVRHGSLYAPEMKETSENVAKLKN